MARKPIEVDITRALDAFKRLSSKLQTQITKGAIKRGANIIKKDVQRNVSNAVIRKGAKYNDMQKGIKISIYKNGEMGLVHTMGDKRFWHSYILRFFGVGTTKRYALKRNGKTLRKQRYLGKMKKFDLFANTSTEKAYKAIDDYVRKRMYKLYNNKK